MFCALIVAAGRGTRLGKDIPKALVEVSGKTILRHSVDAFLESRIFDSIIIVYPEGHLEEFKEITKDLNVKLVVGGETRQESVFNGLQSISEPTTELFVAIHDSARCLIDPEDIKRVCNKAKEKGAAALGVKIIDTIKRVSSENKIIETLPREVLWSVQTPQVFRYSEIKRMHIEKKGKNYTDDCSIIESRVPVFIEEARSPNFKITNPSDLPIFMAHVDTKK